LPSVLRAAGKGFRSRASTSAIPGKHLEFSAGLRERNVRLHAQDRAGAVADIFGGDAHVRHLPDSDFREEKNKVLRQHADYSQLPIIGAEGFAYDVAIRLEFRAPQPVSNDYAVQAVDFIAGYENAAQSCFIAEHFKEIR